ncbi:4Fe-4S ferredoxin, partial [Dickeya dianthicola]|nr:4Fe-4S ferredoxin [Dickeya dianthicola]
MENYTRRRFIAIMGSALAVSGSGLPAVAQETAT